MGKTYRSNVSTKKVGYFEFSDAAKKQHHNRQRKANNSMDWENNERALPVTKHRKQTVVRDLKQVHEPTLVPNFEGRNFRDEMYGSRQYTQPVSNGYCSYEQLPHWTEGSPDTKTVIENIIEENHMVTQRRYQNSYIHREEDVPRDLSFLRACQKQYERRGKPGIFSGHDRTHVF